MKTVFLLALAAGFGYAPASLPQTTTQWICFGSPVPQGYVIVDDGTDYATCNYHAQVRRTNIQYIQDIRESQAGTVVKVCLYSAVPSGWVVIEEGKDLTCNCSHAIVHQNNVKYIRKN